MFLWIHPSQLLHQAVLSEENWKGRREAPRPFDEFAEQDEKFPIFLNRNSTSVAHRAVENFSGLMVIHEQNGSCIVYRLKSLYRCYVTRKR